jgi:hypothetical protein
VQLVSVMDVLLLGLVIIDCFNIWSKYKVVVGFLSLFLVLISMLFKYSTGTSMYFKVFSDATMHLNKF